MIAFVCIYLYKNNNHNMLYLNLSQVLNSRGIENHNRFLVKNGVTRISAYRSLTNSSAGINLKLLEQLCCILNCTPNDLLIWKSDNKDIRSNDHPLQKLQYSSEKLNLNHKLKQIPYEKLEELHKYVDSLSASPPKK